MKGKGNISLKGRGSRVDSVCPFWSQKDPVVLVAPIVYVGREEGRICLQLSHIFKLVFPNCLGVNSDEPTFAVVSVFLSRMPHSLYKCIDSLIAVAVSNYIVVERVDLLDESTQHRGVGKIALPAGLVFAASALVVGIVIQVVILVGLGNPVRFAQLSSVSLDRPVNHELSSSRLEVAGRVLGHESF